MTSAKPIFTFAALLLAVAPLSAQSFDIYVVDVVTGVTRRATFLDDTNEFNASFSPNGKRIVHEVLEGNSNRLYITDLTTGTSTPLEGGDGGNDASWSPDGSLIAFDGAPVGDPSIYTVPAVGGTRTLVRAGGRDPDWNGSTRLVFVDVWDGSVRTIDLTTGAETLVVAYGVNPSWSNNGRQIAYSNGENLFVVSVDEGGNPTGPETQVTFDGPNKYNQQPSWSQDSKNLVFHSNRDNDVWDFNIWTVPAKGGEPTRLGGQDGSGDYDPSTSKNGKSVAFSSQTPFAFSPDLDAAASKSAGRDSGAMGLATSSHPNPFNPSTTIRFSLSQRSPVQLRVFDLVGHQVATLVDRVLEAGAHDVVFDAAHLPSGTYLYRIDAGGEQFVKQIVLLK